MLLPVLTASCASLWHVASLSSALSADRLSQFFLKFSSAATWLLSLSLYLLHSEYGVSSRMPIFLETLSPIVLVSRKHSGPAVIITVFKASSLLLLSRTAFGTVLLQEEPSVCILRAAYAPAMNSLLKKLFYRVFPRSPMMAREPHTGTFKALAMGMLTVTAHCRVHTYTCTQLCMLVRVGEVTINHCASMTLN